MTRHADPRLESLFLEQSGLDPATIEAVGKVTDALETVEVARGHLYAFHRLTGTAEDEIHDAAQHLADAGHHDLADRLMHELTSGPVLAGYWTFQIVEEYDESYYAAFQELEREARILIGGHRHLHKSATSRIHFSRRGMGLHDSTIHLSEEKA